jgi:hypothetical protein
MFWHRFIAGNFYFVQSKNCGINVIFVAIQSLYSFILFTTILLSKLQHNYSKTFYESSYLLVVNSLTTIASHNL